MNEASRTLLKDQTGHVLVVDDEELNRKLLRDLLEGQGNQVTEAENGEQALRKVKENPPDVILLDVLMPGIDGFEVCRRLKADSGTAQMPILLVTGIKERSKMLTGIEAGANDFISKPFDIQDVILRVRNAVYTMHLYHKVQENYEIVQELEKEARELLEKTLVGAVKVLTDILSLVSPSAFSRASRVKEYVRHIVKWLELTDVWEFELAAMLSQIGCVTLSSDLVDKANAGKPLTSEESEMYYEYLGISSTIIENIPRLEHIAAIIRAQLGSKRFVRKGNDLKKADRVDLGGNILKAAFEFDRSLNRGLSPNAILKRLTVKVGDEVPEIFDALRHLQNEQENKSNREIMISELNRSMIFDEDVFDIDGKLLIKKGQQATFPLILRLRNYAKEIGVVQPFRVIVQETA
ncbi:Protein-glutamate methylesterase/protein-glutamine glutaminase [subsurface metagenome]